MARDGMDTEVVGAVSKAMARDAGTLESLIGRADHALGQVMTVWHGADSAGFVDEWQRIHRPALQQVLTGIRELTAALDRNVAEQERTSNDYGDSGGSGHAGTASGRHVGTGSPSQQSIFDRLSHAWESSGADLLDHALSGVDVIHSVAEWAGSLPIAGITDVVGNPLVEGFGYLGTGISEIQDLKSFADGDPFGGFLAIGDGLKAAGPENAVPYLSGMAIDAWTMAGQTAVQTDWSAATAHETWDYVMKNPAVVPEELGKAAMTVFEKVGL